ncbi:hypothetical protein NKI38_32145 [Mesorhizobium sp. M0621]|uniref:hypothetical protein n=1 Tax=Mesorhizobium sp. M0621 TaxID=2956974 RepID=UPI003339F73D
MKDDPRAIFTAASKAQQAANWIHEQQPAAPEAREALSAATDGTNAGQPASPVLADALQQRAHLNLLGDHVLPIAPLPLRVNLRGAGLLPLRVNLRGAGLL